MPKVLLSLYEKGHIIITKRFASSSILPSFFFFYEALAVYMFKHSDGFFPLFVSLIFINHSDGFNCVASSISFVAEKRCRWSFSLLCCTLDPISKFFYILGSLAVNVCGFRLVGFPSSPD